MGALKWFIAALAAFGSGPNVWAGSDSIATVGIGTTMGMTRHQQPDGRTLSGFSSELSVRGRLFYVLSAELAYAPMGPGNMFAAPTHKNASISAGDLVFDSPLRLSGLLYLIPTSPVALYVKGGVGGTGFNDIFQLAAPTSSYHAGGGLDVHWGDHFVVGLEFLWLVPGVGSVLQHSLGPPPPSALSWRNHRVAVSLRYFL